MIMGDASDCLKQLLAPGGADYNLLTREEKESSDTSRLSYTNQDKKVYRHFEGAGEPSKQLCQFLQEDGDAWSYITFQLRHVIKASSADTIPIHADISHMDTTKDLRDRGDKTVLLKKSGVTVPDEVSKNYTKVETMDPLVEHYCELYTEDLTERLGLDEEVLPTSLTFPVLLNPAFGPHKRIVGAGLLTEEQYQRGRQGKCLI